MFVCLAYVTTSQVEGSPFLFPFHFVLPLCQIAKRPWGLIKVCSVVTLYCLRMSDCAPVVELVTLCLPNSEMKCLVCTV